MGGPIYKKKNAKLSLWHSKCNLTFDSGETSGNIFSISFICVYESNQRVSYVFPVGLSCFSCFLGELLESALRLSFFFFPPITGCPCLFGRTSTNSGTVKLMVRQTCNSPKVWNV